MVRSAHTSKQAAELFQVLLKAPDAWRHGYALMRETGLASGSLYPLLMRLADEGFLDSEWEAASDGGRPRKLYRLTASGRSLAHERLARFAARKSGRTEPTGTGR